MKKVLLALIITTAAAIAVNECRKRRNAAIEEESELSDDVEYVSGECLCKRCGICGSQE